MERDIYRDYSGRFPIRHVRAMGKISDVVPACEASAGVSTSRRGFLITVGSGP